LKCKQSHFYIKLSCEQKANIDVNKVKKALVVIILIIDLRFIMIVN